MLPDLQHQFDRLEDGRRTLIETLRPLPDRSLLHKPAPESWSILEEFQHLVLAEQKTGPNFGAASASEEKNPEMVEVVLQVLDQDMRVDVPDPAMVPDGRVGFEKLIQDWETARRRLRHFLESCGPDDLQTVVSRHPVTGPLAVDDYLRLIASHFNHHYRRIEKALAAPDDR